MKTTPYEFQLQDVKRITKFGGRTLVSSDPGTGKSLIALLWARENVKGPVVIVCPATLKVHWQRECSKHLGVRAEILSGKVPGRKASIPDRGIVIINYDILGAVQGRMVPDRKNTWGNALLDMRPELLICDESHYLVSRSARRTQACRFLARNVKYMLALTGTPLVNRPAELWPVLNMLRPNLYPSFFSFGIEFAGGRKAPWGWEFKGATNLDRLHENLCEQMMVRRRKEDVIDQLPSKTRVVLPVELSPAGRREYREAVTDFLHWLEKISPKLAAKARKAERLVRLGYLKRLAARHKLPSVIEWIEDFLTQTDDKLIVFGVHRKVLHRLHERFRGQSVLVDGNVVGPKRQQMIDRFNHDRRVKLFFGNIRAAGTGWSCTSASTVLFAELDWVPGVHTQAEERIRGIGRGVKGKNALVYYMTAADTIENTLCRVLQKKQKDVSAVLDGGERDGDLDVFDALEAALTRKGKVRT